MQTALGNLFTHIPANLPEELVENLFEKDHIKIERIVSRGHTTPADVWYNQNWDEWVLLMQGAATIVYENGQLIDLKPGDYLLIPAHTKHKVAWTEPDIDSIWMAVHIKSTD
jgi:cupin 2 domain-containing protein